MMHDFSMPAEWAPHRRTWMAWPCRKEAWGNADGLTRAKKAYAQVARAISAFEPVVMAARSQDMAEAQAASGCEIFETALDDSWTRDIGPTFVKGTQGLAAVQWRFNGWGGKYAPFDRDARFATHVAETLGVPVRQASIVCEGGAIHGDGAGTLLTTEQCLLNPNRNPGLGKEDVETVFHELLGTQRIVWLGQGFSDGETDGHVDNIACFAGLGRVILGVPDSKSHPDHAPVMEVKRRLTAAGLETIDLVQPVTVRHDAKGRLLQISYVNFTLCNGGLVMPSFDDPHDGPARGVLADCFPGREIAQVSAIDIVKGGGGIHCITQQEPA